MNKKVYSKVYSKCIQKKQHILHVFIHFKKAKKDEPLENTRFSGIHTLKKRHAAGGT